LSVVLTVYPKNEFRAQQFQLIYLKNGPFVDYDGCNISQSVFLKKGTKKKPPHDIIVPRAQ
jgi:hypothetical protein